MNVQFIERRLKPMLFVAGLFPGVLWFYLGFSNQLGPDPAEKLVKELGGWAITFLWITLAITPLRKLSRQSWLTRLRRMFGLFALFYASVHFLSYATFMLGWSPALLADDLLERPYIVVGFLALLLMIPLGITSTDGWRRRLKRDWVRLHKLVYVIAALAMMHFAWTAKAGYGEQAVYLAILLVLMAFRLVPRIRALWAAARD